MNLQQLMGFLMMAEFKTYDGFLTIHQKLGKLEIMMNTILKLKEDQLNSEFIYFAYVLNAPTSSRC